MIDRKNFFDTVRGKLFQGKLNQKHVNGMEIILAEWDKRALQDKRWLAYMLATTYHETARTMQPIEEYGKGTGRLYGKKIKMSGLKYSTPNKLYYGRGFVQLTWYENYETMGRLLHIDLLNQPELALMPEVAAEIMFEGMTKGNSSFGDFTGKSLEMYFNKNVDDPRNARRIINGLDKAKLISSYHEIFLEAVA